MANPKNPEPTLHTPSLSSLPTCGAKPDTLKDELQDHPDTLPTPIPASSSPQYPPSYPIYPNTCPGISYKNPVHLIHLIRFGLYCLTHTPRSPKTLTYAFLTLLCNPKKPKQSNYLFLHKLHHYISHIPLPLTYTYKKPRSFSMNQRVFSVRSSQTPRKPPIHDTFNSFLSYPPHNIIITFIKIYVHTFLLPTKYPLHNSFTHPSSYLYANTYPDPLLLSPIIQNISLAFLLPQCGDVELNPGPYSNIAPNLPPDCKSRRSIYFIPKTIKLNPNTNT
jgi:hypothetical protein